MASLRKCLPLYHHLILLLVLLTSFPHASHLVFADDELIKQQCHNADVPTVCIQCVKSDSRGESADKIGIATILVTCLSNDASNLAKNMSSLASNVKDKNLKTLFQDCEEVFSLAIQDLSNATSQLASGHYDKTNRCVRIALEKELGCKGLLNVNSSTISKVPTDVLYQMRVYEELTDATMRIVDRF